MALLLVNYAIFGDPMLLIIGYAIAGLEAITAVLHFLKTVFKNNPKIVEKIDKKISKYQNAITKLKEREACYRAELAYQSAQTPPENILHTIKEDAEIEKMNKEASDDLAEQERKDFDLRDESEPEPDNESYELFKKFVAQVKNNE